MNRDIFLKFNSSKKRMCNTLLNKFRVFVCENHDKLVRMNRDSMRNKGYNIQRIEYPECNTLFDELKIVQLFRNKHL